MRADANKGSAAIEFAFVAPVFFWLLMAILEIGVIFFAQSALQTAVVDAGRLVRTGQASCFTMTGATCNPMTAAQFRTKVCQNISTLLQDCNGPSLQFDVQPYAGGFGAAGNSSPLDGAGNLPVINAFNVGNACDVVLVRAFYKWPVFTPVLNFFLINMAGNSHLLATATAFRNEPFVNGIAGC